VNHIFTCTQIHAHTHSHTHTHTIMGISCTLPPSCESSVPFPHYQHAYKLIAGPCPKKRRRKKKNTCWSIHSFHFCYCMPKVSANKNMEIYLITIELISIRDAKQQTIFLI